MPDLVLLSAGFDAHVDDPVGNLQLEAADFRWATLQLRAVSRDLWARASARLQRLVVITAASDFRGGLFSGLRQLPASRQKTKTRFAFGGVATPQ